MSSQAKLAFVVLALELVVAWLVYRDWLTEGRLAAHDEQLRDLCARSSSVTASTGSNAKAKTTPKPPAGKRRA